jgi:predicted regulator of Ras-like GTPase activity (Roadblock/LC7/MglB family)
MFRDSLQKMLDRLSGGVAGILMGFDGISVDSYTKPGEEQVDIQTVGMELAHVVLQMRKAAEQIDRGFLREVTLKADQLTIFVHLVNDEYFVACAVKPEANFGKARYLMRLLAPQIQAEL